MNPLGIFDSGIGGLTVAREILLRSPGERIVYIGDTAHVPYGSRSSDEIRAYSLGISRYLVRKHGCRAVVVACNRATSAAVELLRDNLPIPVVGMEPGVKPASEATRSGKIGVLATPGTMSGDRFAALLEKHARKVEVFMQPCTGWVEAVERGDCDSPETRVLIERYVLPLLERGIDTLVLGCTHFPLLRPLIEAVSGPEVAIIDTGPAVARQVERVAGHSESADNSGAASGQRVLVTSTGNDQEAFIARAKRILGEAADTDTRASRLHWKQGELYDDDSVNE